MGKIFQVWDRNGSWMSLSLVSLKQGWSRGENAWGSSMSPPRVRSSLYYSSVQVYQARLSARQFTGDLLTSTEFNLMICLDISVSLACAITWCCLSSKHGKATRCQKNWKVAFWLVKAGVGKEDVWHENQVLRPSAQEMLVCSQRMPLRKYLSKTSQQIF